MSATAPAPAVRSTDGTLWLAYRAADAEVVLRAAAAINPAHALAALLA